MEGGSTAGNGPNRASRTPLEKTATVLVIVVCIAVLCKILIDVVVEFHRPGVSAVNNNPPTLVRPTPANPLAIPSEPVSIAGAAVLGSKDARVAVIEHSDIQCPYCGKFDRETEPTLRAKYVETGKVLLVFRHLPIDALHPLAENAAESMECAGRQNKFWEMKSLLFANQKALDLISIEGRATKLGLDIGRFRKCMAGESVGRVREDLDSALKLGITATPTFMIGRLEGDGRVRVTHLVSGAQPMRPFADALDALLADQAGDRHR